MTVDWAAPYRGRTVLVLGAGGFIGRRVARRLALSGAVVQAVVRPGSIGPASGPAGIRRLEVDLARSGTAADAVRQAGPEITFNLAGYGVDPAERDPGLAERINRGVVEELVAACAARPEGGWPGLQLVHAGSALEYGMAAGDLAETTAPLPGTLYGRTKLAATLAIGEAVAAGRLRGVTARLFTVYGPGEHPGRLVPTLLAAARSQGPIPLSTGTQRRDFTFVDDVVEGLLRLGALAGGTPAVVNLASGELETVRRFVERAAGVLGIEPDRLRFGELPARPEEMHHDRVSVARLVALTGWHPATPIEEGIRLTEAESGPT